MRRLRDFPIEFSNSRHRHCERSEAIHLSPQRKKRMDCFAALAMTCNPDAVIPGWSAGPDPESRDSGFDASHRPGMTESGSLPLRNDAKLKSTYDFSPSPRNAPEPLLNLSPLRGRGECRMPNAPAVSCAMVVVERTRVTTSTPETPGIPARNGFNGLLRAPR